MNIQEHIKYWLDSAENDLIAAENLFKAGNYDWCLFIGHLVLEKALKAIYVKKSANKIPPKIHNLKKLSELINLHLVEEYELFFIKSNKFHIEGRYPQYKQEFYKLCTKEYASNNLYKIKEIFQWLKSLTK